MSQLDRQGEGVSDAAQNLDRLAGPGFRAFLNICAAWELTLDEQMILLGETNRSLFEECRSNRDAQLTLGQLERVSHLLGIYKSLQILLPTTADGWVKRPNQGSLFGGRTPLDVMLAEGLEGLRKVRLLLGAQCDG